MATPAYAYNIYIIHDNGQSNETSQPYYDKLSELFVSRSGLDSVSGSGIDPHGADLTVTIKPMREMAVTEFETVEGILDQEPTTEDENTYTLICHDTSTTTANAEVVGDMLAAAGLVNSGDNAWELFYLSRWLDKCDSMTATANVNGYANSIADTPSPFGIQCLILSKTGRTRLRTLMEAAKVSGAVPETPLNILINSWIMNSTDPEIRAKAATPNLFVYDIARKTSKSDYSKTNECRESAPAKKLKTKDANQTFFWFMIIFAIVLLVAWFIVKLTPPINPNSRCYQTKDNFWGWLSTK
jgi:hypothetical protein